MNKTFIKLLWEIKQFYQPFPNIASLAYKIKVWQYDQIHGVPSVEKINIEPYPLETGHDNNKMFDISDRVSYDDSNGVGNVDDDSNGAPRSVSSDDRTRT